MIVCRENEKQRERGYTDVCQSENTELNLKTIFIIMQEIKTPRLHGKSACETILSEFQTLHRVYLLIARSSWQKGITTQATVLRTFVFFSSCLLVCCNPRQPWRRGSDEPRSLLYATVLTTKVIAYRPEPLLAISGQPHVILEEPKTF